VSIKRFPHGELGLGELEGAANRRPEVRREHGGRRQGEDDGEAFVSDEASEYV